MTAMVVYRMMMVILLISLKKWCCRGLDFFRMHYLLMPQGSLSDDHTMGEHHGDGGDSNDDYKKMTMMVTIR